MSSQPSKPMTNSFNREQGKDNKFASQKASRKTETTENQDWIRQQKMRLSMGLFQLNTLEKLYDEADRSYKSVLVPRQVLEAVIIDLSSAFEQVFDQLERLQATTIRHGILSDIYTQSVTDNQAIVDVLRKRKGGSNVS